MLAVCDAGKEADTGKEADAGKEAESSKGGGKEGEVARGWSWRLGKDRLAYPCCGCPTSPLGGG